MPKDLELATLAGGCFWCTEAIFQRLKGVEKVISGYSGGEMENPKYEAVTSGTTGHAEAIQVTFDPKEISFEKILEVFFNLHDPTTLNQQGADIGTQYRSIIFFADKNQELKAQKAKSEAQKNYSNPIITEIVPLESFTRAEDYHQNFYNNNKMYGYCQIVIDPKIKKLYKDFKDIVKE